MTAITVYKDVEVEVDLSEFNTNELVEELESRGLTGVEQNFSYNVRLLEQIWQLRRFKRDYQHELDELLYNTIGKIA